MINVEPYQTWWDKFIANTLQSANVGENEIVFDIFDNDHYDQLIDQLMSYDIGIVGVWTKNGLKVNFRDSSETMIGRLLQTE